MKKTFQVAGHKFSLLMKEGHPLWKELAQYDPFASEGEDTRFDMELVENLELPSKSLYFDQPTEEGETKIIIYKSGEDWYFESMPTSQWPVVMQLWASADFTKAKLHIVKPSQALFALNNAMMLMFAFSTAAYGTLEMHASVIQNSGKAYLFLAKSGTGKSTHSRMWLENIEGSTLLNDDNPIVRVLPDGQIRVYGSPWSGKTPCYVNEGHPVGGIVRLRQAPYNRYTECIDIEAFANILPSCSAVRGDRVLQTRLHDNLAEICSSVRSGVLDCRPDEEAAILCERNICGSSIK